MSSRDRLICFLLRANHLRPTNWFASNSIPALALDTDGLSCVDRVCVVGRLEDCTSLIVCVRRRAKLLLILVLYHCLPNSYAFLNQIVLRPACHTQHLDIVLRIHGRVLRSFWIIKRIKKLDCGLRRRTKSFIESLPCRFATTQTVFQLLCRNSLL